MSFTASTLSAHVGAGRYRPEASGATGEGRSARSGPGRRAGGLRKEFDERDVKPQALELIASLIRKAVENGEKEVLVMRFPSVLAAGPGRAITNKDKDWPESWTVSPGAPTTTSCSELQPRGFEIRARSWTGPAALPGDVGMFLNGKSGEW